MQILLSGLFEAKTYDFINRDEDLVELFTIAKTVGFDGVDYLATIPDAFYKPKKAIELSKKYDIPVKSMHAPLHLLLASPIFLMDRIVKTIRHFPKLHVFNFHLSGFFHILDRKGKGLENFIKIAKKHNAPVSFESNPKMLGLWTYPTLTYEPEVFAQFCIKNNLGITFDTSHVAHCGYDIVTFFKKYHKHIKLIHLSDAFDKIQHLPLGKGNLPIKKLLSEIKQASYNEVVTFEICNFPKNTTTKEKIKDIAESFSMVKQYAC